MQMFVWIASTKKGNNCPQMAPPKKGICRQILPEIGEMACIVL